MIYTSMKHGVHFRNTKEFTEKGIQMLARRLGLAFRFHTPLMGGNLRGMLVHKRSGKVAYYRTILFDFKSPPSKEEIRRLKQDLILSAMRRRGAPNV